MTSMTSMPPFPTDSGLADISRALARQFHQAGLPAAGLDARLLLCHAAGLSHEEFARQPEKTLSAAGHNRLSRMARRRLAHEPVARLIGKKEFFGMEFLLSAKTLVPRPDSETLITAALDFIGDSDSARVLDLGTGSGCLLLALLRHRKNAFGLGIDLSADAIRTARKNARRMSLDSRARFQTGNWGDGIDGQFSLILSNPPYIPRDDLDRLPPDVRHHDPLAALDGGSDGLDSLRRVIAQAPALLRPGGGLMVEIGLGQERPVRRLMETAGLRLFPTRHDLAGRPRAICAICPGRPGRPEGG